MKYASFTGDSAQIHRHYVHRPESPYLDHLSTNQTESQPILALTVIKPCIIIYFSTRVLHFRDKDNLEVSNPVPRRTSYEKAVQRNRSPAAREKDEGMGKKENREPFHRKTEETEKNTAPPPPPVPKRKDW